MIRVEVRAHIFPYRSIDPAAPGLIHFAYDDINRVLYCSRYAFERLSKLPDAQKDELIFAMGPSP